jgi:hypothetical protein
VNQDTTTIIRHLPGERHPTANYRMRCITPECPKGPCIPCMSQDRLISKESVFAYESRDAHCAVDLVDGSQIVLRCVVVLEHWNGTEWEEVGEDA